MPVNDAKRDSYSKVSYSLPPSISSVEIDGNTVLLNLETGYYFGLDEVGTLIWTHLKDGKSLPDIVTRIVAIYEVDEKKAERDVMSFCEGLVKKGLLLCK